LRCRVEAAEPLWIGEDSSGAVRVREVRDEDLAVLFEQWADPVAARMAAFTSPDHMDRDAFERRWSRLRADETVINRAIVVEGEVAVDPSRPLHARVAHDNVASRRVLEKCGFRVVATERSFAEGRSGEIEEVLLQLERA
jgi:RimJ/RimL family protein N-acetyltransferase